MLAGTGEKVQASTTTAFARLLRNLLRDPGIGSRVVPIIPDEARTFGLDALFREFKIYAPFGQPYEPVDAELLLSYREARSGRILEEGITEAGSMASFTAAGTAYATWGQPMIPFFIFYSMFGFQRVGDLIWAFGDQRGRGFLLGATAGRTTLTGEGLQHCDGHSQVLASTVPNCRAYDPAFAYEMAVIIRDGIERMYGAEPEDCFYYLTLYNENYSMPPMPDGVEDGIVRGLYRYREAAGERVHAARRSSRAAPRCSRRSTRRQMLARRVRRRRRRVERDELQAAARGRAEHASAGTGCTRPSRRARRTSPSSSPTPRGPIVAVTDFMKAVPDQIAPFVPQPFMPLGTDGYGFSDTRAALRRHFEVDAPQHRGRGAPRAGGDAVRSRTRSSTRPSPATTSTPTSPTPASA